MASLEFDRASETYRVRFRYAGREYKRSLKTSDRKVARGLLGRIDYTVQLIERGEAGRMVTLSDGNYSHVPIDTLLHGKKSVDVSALYDRATYRARLMRVEGMPMFLY